MLIFSIIGIVLIIFLIILSFFLYFKWKKEKIPVFLDEKLSEGVYKIYTSTGHLIGERPFHHPDINEALNTPSLLVRFPDGTVKRGK